MSHEVLALKIHELEKKIDSLYGHIKISESGSQSQIQSDIENLRCEYSEEQLVLSRKMKYSKSEFVTKLSDSYDEIEKIISETEDSISAVPQSDEIGSIPSDTSVNEKILLAEYSLDFALLAAQRALLVSLEAMEAQIEYEKGEK